MNKNLSKKNPNKWYVSRRPSHILTFLLCTDRHLLFHHHITLQQYIIYIPYYSHNKSWTLRNSLLSLSQPRKRVPSPSTDPSKERTDHTSSSLELDNNCTPWRWRIRSRLNNWKRLCHQSWRRASSTSQIRRKPRSNKFSSSLKISILDSFFSKRHKQQIQERPNPQLKIHTTYWANKNNLDIIDVHGINDALPSYRDYLFGFRNTSMTESPLKNNLLVNLVLLIGLAFFLPLPLLGCSVHISWTFSKIILQWRSKAFTLAKSFRLFLQLINICVCSRTLSNKRDRGPFSNCNSSSFSNSSAVFCGSMGCVASDIFCWWERRVVLVQQAQSTSTKHSMRWWNTKLKMSHHEEAEFVDVFPPPPPFYRLYHPTKSEYIPPNPPKPIAAGEKYTSFGEGIVASVGYKLSEDDNFESGWI